MKRFLSTFLASLLLVSSAFAQVPTVSQVNIPAVSRSLITVEKVQPTVLEQLYAIGGLTFFADYSDGENGVNAEYALGNPMGTFTRTGTAYYVDHTGTWQLAATNTPRFTYGTYSESGWTLFDTNGKLLVGLMIESAMTNRATYCNNPENAAWTKTNITADNDDPTSTSPDGTATACSLTATDANATFTQSYTDASAGIYTASIFIKRKTGTGTINLRANTVNAYTDITSNVKNYWTRIPVSSTSLTNPTFDLQIVTSGDAVYIWNPQLEKNPYMTSPIPSLTTAVARGAEVLKYFIAGNRTAVQESIYINFYTLWDSTEPSLFLGLSDTDTKERDVYLDPATDKIVFFPNRTDSITSTVSLTSNLYKNTLYNISCIAYGPSGDPNAKIYLDSSEQGSTDIGYTTPVFGTYFYVGSRVTLDRQLNGIVKNICIFNRIDKSNKISNIVGLL